MQDFDCSVDPMHPECQEIPLVGDDQMWDGPKDGHMDGDRDGMRDGDRDGDRMMMEDGGDNPWMDRATQANVAFLMTAVSTVAWALLDEFRYNPLADSFCTDDMKTAQGGTNYFCLSKTISLWSGVAFFGVAAITQLLSMFGIAVDVNLMVWGYGGMAMMLVGAVSSLLGFLGYDAAHVLANDDTADAGDSALAAAAKASFESEMIKDVVYETAIGFELYMNEKAWYRAQMRALRDAEGMKEMDGDRMRDGDRMEGDRMEGDRMEGDRMEGDRMEGDGSMPPPEGLFAF